jgi:hypothetical protein
MALVEISDFVLWAKHIHGDAFLQERVLALVAGEIVHLTVDGSTGTWKRMEDGKNGVPTPGLKPIGRAKQRWHELYRERRGDLVEIALAPGGSRPATLMTSSTETCHDQA